MQRQAGRTRTKAEAGQIAHQRVDQQVHLAPAQEFVHVLAFSHERFQSTSVGERGEQEEGEGGDVVEDHAGAEMSVSRSSAVDPKIHEAEFREQWGP